MVDAAGNKIKLDKSGGGGQLAKPLDRKERKMLEKELKEAQVFAFLLFRIRISTHHCCVLLYHVLLVLRNKIVTCGSQSNGEDTYELEFRLGRFDEKRTATAPAPALPAKSELKPKPNTNTNQTPGA